MSQVHDNKKPFSHRRFKGVGWHYMLFFLDFPPSEKRRPFIGLFIVENIFQWGATGEVGLASLDVGEPNGS